MQKQKKRKKQVARTPVEVAKYKERVLKWLAKGKSPGTAARLSNISRCTIYVWKKEDEEFSAAWNDAVETGLDELESRVYARGMKDSISDAQFTLKYRRYDRERSDRPQSNFILNITLQEQYKRLERLGIPLPVIESDLEDDDAAANNP